MKRVALYVRVSTQEQKKHGLSVDSQIVALQGFAKQEGYIVAGIYNDAGISARKRYTKRPALLQLMKDCQEGKIDLILFTKLDRWFRSVADYYEVQSVLDKTKVAWRAIWEDYETETSAGIFKVNIMLSVAQSEADRTSERIKSTFEYKRACGDYVGQAPFGYMRKDKKLVKNPDQAPFVELIFKTYSETHSSTACMRKLIDAGCNLSKSSVAKIIRSETYCGNAYGFACDPYISKEEHDRLIQIRAINHRAPAQTHTYIFSNLCRCAVCGAKMRSMASNIKGVYYKNYFCTGIDRLQKHEEGFSISEKRLEAYMLAELDTILKDYNMKAETEAFDIVAEEALKKRRSLESKLDRIGIRFEEGDLSADEYREKRKQILSEIASTNVASTSRKINLPSDWKEVYWELDDDHRQKFWFSIIKSITLTKGMKIPPVIEFL